MKALERNKQSFWYANLNANVPPAPKYDEYGNESGDMGLTYDLPTEVHANVSASRGTADLDAFGIGTNYSKTIAIDNLTLPIDEHTILWIECVPDANGEAGAVKHDYAVVAVAKSLNSMMIAVKEVSVS